MLPWRLVAALHVQPPAYPLSTHGTGRVVNACCAPCHSRAASIPMHQQIMLPPSQKKAASPGAGLKFGVPTGWDNDGSKGKRYSDDEDEDASARKQEKKDKKDKKVTFLVDKFYLVGMHLVYTTGLAFTRVRQSEITWTWPKVHFSPLTHPCLFCASSLYKSLT
jgi:hypothetical protein